MNIETQQIMEKLDTIKEELDYIKDHMVDVDTILTPDEEARLDESLDDFKNGRTTSVERFEKEMKQNHDEHRVRYNEGHK